MEEFLLHIMNLCLSYCMSFNNTTPWCMLEMLVKPTVCDAGRVDYDVCQSVSYCISSILIKLFCPVQYACQWRKFRPEMSLISVQNSTKSQPGANVLFWFCNSPIKGERNELDTNRTLWVSSISTKIVLIKHPVFKGIIKLQKNYFIPALSSRSWIQALTTLRYLLLTLMRLKTKIVHYTCIPFFLILLQ